MLIRHSSDMISDSPVIDIIAGARPNFMKIAPVIHALWRRGSPRAARYATGWCTPGSTMIPSYQILFLSNWGFLSPT
jgi:hypothetical protein